MESMTYIFKFDIAEDMKGLTELISLLENQLYYQKRQRPYFIPYIRQLEQNLQKYRLDLVHLKDRLDKLDGCF